MDIYTIIFFTIFAIVGFIIIYASLRAGAWFKYNQIDEEILDLKGEVVDAKLVSSKKIAADPRYYEIKLSYIDPMGQEQVARPVTYQKITRNDVKYLKKCQTVKALAYEDILEIDFSNMDDSEGDIEWGPSLFLLVMKQFFPIFQKRFGFPPKHPRKALLKELKRNE